MKTINLFIASSSSLSVERSEIERFIARKNDSLINSGIYLKTVIWEKQSRKFSQSRKQEEFNKLVDSSEIFICIVYDKVGQFTLEEFERAYTGFKSGKYPKNILIYFKDTPIRISEISDFESVRKLRESIQKRAQIWSTFDSTPSLLLSIDRELNHAIESIKDVDDNREHSMYEVEFVHTVLDIQDSQGRLVNFKKFQLLKAVKPFQYLYDAIAVDGKINIDSINVDKGASRKIVEHINYVDVITDLGFLVEKNHRITKTFTCEILDSFTKTREVWEDDNVNKVGFLKTTIIFPENRKYVDFQSNILRGFREKEITPPREIIVDGRFALDLEIENEQTFDKIRTYWNW